MKISYSIHKVPNLQSENNEETHQARINSSGTIKTEELCTLISARSSISAADVKATLDSLNFCFNYYLAQGYNIELDDLGIFSLGLKSRKEQSETAGNLLSVKVNGIHFRPSVKLKEQIRGFQLTHKSRKTIKQYTQEERLKRILKNVEKYGYTTRTACQELNKVTRYIANTDLHHLITTRTLKAVGSTCNRVYIKAEVLSAEAIKTEP